MIDVLGVWHGGPSRVLNEQRDFVHELAPRYETIFFEDGLLEYVRGARSTTIPLGDDSVVREYGGGNFLRGLLAEARQSEQDRLQWRQRSLFESSDESRKAKHRILDLEYDLLSRGQSGICGVAQVREWFAIKNRTLPLVFPEHQPNWNYLKQSFWQFSSVSRHCRNPSLVVLGGLHEAQLSSLLCLPETTLGEAAYHFWDPALAEDLVHCGGCSVRIYRSIRDSD